MPIAKYFKGKGEEVMGDMQSRHGADKAKQVFYATANKQDQNPPAKTKAKFKRKSFSQRLAGK